MRTSTSMLLRASLAGAALVVLQAAAPAFAQTPALVSAASPGVVISSTQATATVPVTIGRDATTPLLGFSVRIQLSSEFTAPSPATDFAIGSFMTEKPGGGTAQTTFRVTPDPVIPGRFTVDGVTLGPDCGPIAQAGTLFTVTLRSAAAAGTGTVTIESVLLRDCENSPVTTAIGTVASVVIDNSPPSVAVTSPNGTETWVYQTTRPVTWSATDLGGGVATLDLDYSTDGGSNWTPIVAGVTNTGSYSWPVPNAPTTNALVRVTARDIHGNSSTDASDAAFTILSNSAPVLGVIGPRSVDELATLSFTASATDGEAPPQALTYTLAGAPSGATIDPSTGAFSWTPTELQGPGPYAFSVVVTDNGTPNLVDSEAITVTVGEVNVAPSLDPIADQPTSEGVAVAFMALADDIDLPANTLTFSLPVAPATASIDPSTGAFSWTPGESDGGSAPAVTVRVTDNGSPPLHAERSFVITVSEANTPPVLTGVPVGPVVIPEMAAYSFDAAANDTDVPIQTLTFSLVGAPDGAAIDPETGLFSWTPAEDQDGNHTFTVRLSDGVANTDASVTLQVTEANLPPTLANVPADATIPELAAYTFTATPGDPDLPANTLTLSLVNGPAGAAISPAGVFTWTPTEAQGPGDHAFFVRVSDGTVNVDVPITLHVTDTNSPPTLTGVPASPADVPEMQLYTFDADAVDTDLPEQVLAFSLVGAPTGAAIDPGTGVFSWTPAEDQDGDHTFTVQVSDGVTNTVESLTLHVTEVNRAPSLSGVPADVTIPELVAYTFTATASDPDLPGNTLTLSLVGAPAGAAISPAGVFTWTPTEAQGPGDHVFAVRVSDGTVNVDVPITLHVTEVSIAAITDLAASIVRSGNDGDGTTKILLNWTATPGGTTVAVYRARFGFYPRYDEDGGAPPAPPAWSPTSPWELTAVTSPGGTDEVSNGPLGFAGRDYWYYVAFVLGEGANVSGPSNQPARPNYLLGDVSDGTLEGLGRGNNVVNTADIAALGDSYGLSGSSLDGVRYLDVGPTTDYSVNGRPVTDGALEFEDLVMYALNYGAGTAQQMAAKPRNGATAAKGADRLMVRAPDAATEGQEFTVALLLEGTGNVQALSAVLDWDPAQARPLGVEAGEWTTQLQGVAFSPRPGVADVSLLGARAAGFEGEGVVATVRFRALAACRPRVALASVRARDAANQNVAITTGVLSSQPVLPGVTLLAPAFPNPFRGSASVAFSLARSGPVTVAVYGVDGRLVRTLANGPREPGSYRLEWDGRDNAGQAMSAGVYFVQMVTPDGRQTKRISYLR